MFVLRTVNISNDGEITKEGATYIPHSKVREYERFLLQAHDILFVMVGATLGKVGYVRESALPALLNQNMWVIRTLDGHKLDQRYLHYCFKHFSSKVLGWASGSARGFVKREDFRNLDLEIPPIDEQEQIAALLTAIDDKIELNQRMNETLEAMATAFFKSWFVDFDPVRAKAEGRKPEGMDVATAALFPAAFNDDGLPEGWDKIPFSGLIEIIGGGTPKTSIPEYWNGAIPWFSVVDAPADTDIFVIDTEKKITQAGVDNSSTKVLPFGTTIISARGTVGKVALVGVPMAMNQSCYAMRGANGLPDYFTHFCVRQLVTELKARAHGSVFDTITRETFDTVSFVKPDKKVAQAFDERILPIMQKVLNNLHENKTLSGLRDALLPKLISGELRIQDAREQVKEAV